MAEQDGINFRLPQNRPNLLASPSGREVAFTAPPSERTWKWLEEAVERQALQTHQRKLINNDIFNY